MVVYFNFVCNINRVKEWPLSNSGLFLDREWALIGTDGSALSLKNYPRMSKVRPSIDLDSGQMILSAPDITSSSIIIPFQMSAMSNKISVRICSYRCDALEESSEITNGNDDDVHTWFSRILEVPCRLVRRLPDQKLDGKYLILNNL